MSTDDQKELRRAEYDKGYAEGLLEALDDFPQPDAVDPFEYIAKSSLSEIG